MDGEEASNAAAATTFERVEYRLPNSAGIELFCRLWKPTESSPRAVVFLAHGYGEHIAYYEGLATTLVKESYLVFAHDHVGHGQSGGVRVHIDSVDDYVKDVVAHFEKVAQEVPADLPRFIVGHSMGGTIAIKTAMCNPQMFHGVVLIAPAVVISPEVATPMRIFFVKIVSRLIPQFPVAPIEWNMVTRNPEMVEKYSHDPLCHQGKVKAKWALAMYNALQEINNNLTNVEWPFLVLHGSDDKITNVSGSKLLFDLASSRDKQIKIHEEASHNLLQELDDVRSAVLAEVAAWISQRLVARTEAKPTEGDVPKSDESAVPLAGDEASAGRKSPTTELEAEAIEVAKEVVESPPPTTTEETQSKEQSRVSENQDQILVEEHQESRPEEVVQSENGGTREEPRESPLEPAPETHTEGQVSAPQEPHGDQSASADKVTVVDSTPDNQESQPRAHEEHH